MRTVPVLAAACFLLAGCSFNRQWQSALREPTLGNTFAGPWEGRWLSDKNGHTGRLRCIMTPSGTNTYNASFHATFWKIFRAGYQVPFAVTNDGTQFRFSGQSNLGKLGGGLYTYVGEATSEQFKADYRSKYDHGKFEMARPAR